MTWIINFILDIWKQLFDAMYNSCSQLIQQNESHVDYFKSNSLYLLKFYGFQILCRKPKKPSEPTIRCCTSTGPIAAAVANRTDLEGMSERYWGEILERTVSSSSLQAMPRMVPPPLPAPAPSRRTQWCALFGWSFHCSVTKESFSDQNWCEVHGIKTHSTL